MHDPEVKKVSYAEKCRQNRAQDLKDIEHRRHWNFVKAFYIMTAIAVLCLIIAMSTVAWYGHNEEQITFTLSNSQLIRDVTFAMSFEGVQIFIDYCPKEGEVVDGSSVCVTEKDSYNKFAEIEFWAEVFGRTSASEYSEAVASANSAGTLMLALLLTQVFVNLCVAGVMTYGVVKTPHLRLCQFALGFLLFFGLGGVASVGLFEINTGPFRKLLKEDNFVQDCKPDMTMGFSFYLGTIGALCLLLSGYPFYMVMPHDDGTAEGSAKDEFLIKQRMARVKQYREDTVNTTHITEHETDQINPRLKAVATRSAPGKVQLPPIPGAGSPVKDLDFPMVQPGKPLRLPGSPLPGSPVPFGLTTGSPLPGIPEVTPVTPISLTPVKIDDLEETIVEINQINQALSSERFADTGGPEAPGSPGYKTIPNSPSAAFRAKAGPPKLPGSMPPPLPESDMPISIYSGFELSRPNNGVRPATRERTVTRCPGLKDTSFGRQAHPGVTNTGLICNLRDVDQPQESKKKPITF